MCMYSMCVHLCSFHTFIRLFGCMCSFCFNWLFFFWASSFFANNNRCKCRVERMPNKVERRLPTQTKDIEPSLDPLDPLDPPLGSRPQYTNTLNNDRVCLPQVVCVDSYNHLTLVNSALYTKVERLSPPLPEVSLCWYWKCPGQDTRSFKSFVVIVLPMKSWSFCPCKSNALYIFPTT